MFHRARAGRIALLAALVLFVALMSGLANRMIYFPTRAHDGGTPASIGLAYEDVVLDASGVREPAYLGAGGIPAAGERAVAGDVVRQLGDLHAKEPELGGRSILVVGHGHSAANAISM